MLRDRRSEIPNLSQNLWTFDWWFFVFIFLPSLFMQIFYVIFTLYSKVLEQKPVNIWLIVCFVLPLFAQDSSADSDLEVDCVYIPTRVVNAAGHIRETAGHLRESAGHLREQIGEQAGHYREKLGDRADQIVQLSGQFREQVGEQTQKIVVQAENVVHKVKDVAWRVTHHSLLPHWLKDNDFLHNYHRPPLPSFRSCFKSTFRIHTETGNIWTHMLGKSTRLWTTT